MDKKRTTSFTKQSLNMYWDRYDQKQFYCPKQRKDVKNLINNLNNLKIKSPYENNNTMNVSLKNILKELQNKSPKQYLKKQLKKTPSTSIHTPADFTIPNIEHQSGISKQIQHSQQNSYRSMTLWSQNHYIQQDQMAVIEYRTQLDIMATSNADWKNVYNPPKGNRCSTHIQHVDNLEFQCWKEFIENKVLLRIAMQERRKELNF